MLFYAMIKIKLKFFTRSFAYLSAYQWKREKSKICMRTWKMLLKLFLLTVPSCPVMTWDSGTPLCCDIVCAQ